MKLFVFLITSKYKSTNWPYYVEGFFSVCGGSIYLRAGPPPTLSPPIDASTGNHTNYTLCKWTTHAPHRQDRPEIQQTTVFVMQKIMLENKSDVSDRCWGKIL